MLVFPKIGGKPPKSSILIGFSIIFTIHFGGLPIIFGNTQDGANENDLILRLQRFLSSGESGGRAADKTDVSFGLDV